MMAPTSGNPKDRKKEPPLSTPEALPAPRAGGRRGALRRLPTAREGRQTRASQRRRRRRRSRATSTEGTREQGCWKPEREGCEEWPEGVRGGGGREVLREDDSRDFKDLRYFAYLEISSSDQSRHSSQRELRSQSNPRN